MIHVQCRAVGFEAKCGPETRAAGVRGEDIEGDGACRRGRSMFDVISPNSERPYHFVCL